jgi:hypothetical protein
MTALTMVGVAIAAEMRMMAGAGEEEEDRWIAT